MTDKKFEELDSNELKELKIEFAPGCFDGFEGTQEELDELVAQIKEMFASGEAQKLARQIDFEDLDESDLEILERYDSVDGGGRNLQ